MSTPIASYQRSERGVTLVEIMVGLVVGSLIVIAASQMLVQNRATFRTTDDSARAQENGQFAIDYLYRHIRLAGFVIRNGGTNTDLLKPLRSTDFFKAGAVAAASSCAGSITHPICGANDVLPNSSDVLVVRFRGVDNDNPATPNTASGGVVDCAGANVGADDLIEERFQIRIDPATQRPQLVCFIIRATITTEGIITGAPPPPAEPPGATMVVIADSIFRMQVLYGLKDPTNLFATSPTVQRWVTAATPTLLGDTIAVRVALLAEGIEGGSSVVQDTHLYQFFGPDYDASADSGAEYVPNNNRVRRLYSATVSLRNRLM